MGRIMPVPVGYSTGVAVRLSDTWEGLISLCMHSPWDCSSREGRREPHQRWVSPKRSSRMEPLAVTPQGQGNWGPAGIKHQDGKGVMVGNLKLR